MPHRLTLSAYGTRLRGWHYYEPQWASPSSASAGAVSRQPPRRASAAASKPLTPLRPAVPPAHPEAVPPRCRLPGASAAADCLAALRCSPAPLSRQNPSVASAGWRSQRLRCVWRRACVVAHNRTNAQCFHSVRCRDTSQSFSVKIQDWPVPATAGAAPVGGRPLPGPGTDAAAGTPGCCGGAPSTAISVGPVGPDPGSACICRVTVS